jgi:hypothetical protein
MDEERQGRMSKGDTGDEQEVCDTDVLVPRQAQGGILIVE